MKDIKFRSARHEHDFYALLKRMGGRNDCYHLSVAYLITLDTVCFAHLNDLFDLKGNRIKLDGLECSWQTGTSIKTTRLMFNLWCGFVADHEEDEDEPSLYSVVEIFCCNYAPYYFEAVKLRYPEYAQ